MKITMLGTTGSGKTTYLSALLGILYSGAINEFVIRPGDTSDAEIARQIEDINTLYSDGKFPEGTEDIRNLNLCLFKGKTRLVDFDFIDYRGGYLDEISKDENSFATQKLTTAILASDVALVFVDAIVLNACKNIMVARNYLGVNPITTVLLRAKKLASRANKKIKIVFVLTKTDATTIKIENIPSLKNRIPDLYSSLYADFGCEANSFTIYDIGAVGNNAVQTTAEWQIGKENNRFINIQNTIISMDLDFRPKNIASVLAQAFLEGIDNVSYDVNKMEEILESKQADFGVVKQIVDILFHKSKKRHEIRKLSEEIQESKNQLAQLKRYKSDLQDIIINNY